MTDLDMRMTDWIGRTAYDAHGEKIGRIENVYADDQTGRAEWVTVKTGWFGTNVSFVPIRGAERQDDDMIVAWDKDTVKNAPNLDADAHLSEEEERRLYAHYGIQERGFEAPTTGRAAGRTDDAMTRSEEKVTAHAEREQAGRARLRKWVETEHETVTVPVRKEKARLVTEPITDANRDRAMSGPDLTESEHEVVLSEERAVVDTEVVPKERVRLEKDVEVTEERVGADVRKERIELDEDESTRRR
jgi:stress response protein YsnF